MTAELTDGIEAGTADGGGPGPDEPFEPPERAPVPGGCIPRERASGRGDR
ncbi:hypothetical protein [Streptomyces atacamensis]